MGDAISRATHWCRRCCSALSRPIAAALGSAGEPSWRARWHRSRRVHAPRRHRSPRLHTRTNNACMRELRHTARCVDQQWRLVWVASNATAQRRARTVVRQVAECQAGALLHLRHTRVTLHDVYYHAKHARHVSQGWPCGGICCEWAYAVVTAVRNRCHRSRRASPHPCITCRHALTDPVVAAACGKPKHPDVKRHHVVGGGWVGRGGSSRA